MKKIHLIITATIVVLVMSACVAVIVKKNTSPHIIQSSSQSSHIGCSHTFVSWNLQNFGKNKSDETIEKIAKTVCTRADLVAIQEVTAGKLFGAQTIAKLALACSRLGSEWDYIVSNPTRPSSPGVERYAFLWKKNTISTNRESAQLVEELEKQIDREPYKAIFEPKGGTPITVYTMHAVPTEKSPINEIRALETSKELQGAGRAIFSGDFNLDKRATDPSFVQLGFNGYISEPTSLRTKVFGKQYRVKQYDNIYTKNVHVCSSGVIDFVEKFYYPVTDESLRSARLLSDHLPVYINFK